MNPCVCLFRTFPSSVIYALFGDLSNRSLYRGANHFRQADNAPHPETGLLLDLRSKQAKFLEIDIRQRILFLGEEIGIGRWLRYRKIGRHSRRK